MSHNNAETENASSARIVKHNARKLRRNKHIPCPTPSIVFRASRLARSSPVDMCVVAGHTLYTFFAVSPEPHPQASRTTVVLAVRK